MDLFELTKSLMNIPSVSGDEEAVGFYLRDYLESLGWTVELAGGFGKAEQCHRLFERDAACLAVDAYGHGAAVYRSDRGR